MAEMTLTGKRVCIDPGHPSEVGIGTRGKKLTEVGVAWTVALRLRALLQERGASVQLTKKAEREYVTNRRRAEIANVFQADLLVRLHCDSEGRSGIAVFYPDRQGKDRTGFVGPARTVLAATARVAPVFHRALMRSLAGALPDRGLLSDIRSAIGAKQGALTGSIRSTVPVLLVEMVILTNPKDEAFIASPSGHERMARALTDATEAALTIPS